MKKKALKNKKPEVETESDTTRLLDARYYRDLLKKLIHALSIEPHFITTMRLLMLDKKAVQDPKALRKNEESVRKEWEKYTPKHKNGGLECKIRKRRMKLNWKIN